MTGEIPKLNESIMLVDLLVGMRGVRFCKKSKGIRRLFDIIMPNWMIRNEEIDLVAILGSEIRRRLDLYRKKIPVKNKKRAQIIYIIGEPYITIDSHSIACVERDETHVIFSMAIRVSNSKW